MKRRSVLLGLFGIGAAPVLPKIPVVEAAKAAEMVLDDYELGSFTPQVMVYVAGILQPPDVYELRKGVLTFSEVLQPGEHVTVVQMAIKPEQIIQHDMKGNGSANLPCNIVEERTLRTSPSSIARTWAHSL